MDSFPQLFVGGEQSHGVLYPSGNGKWGARTEMGPATAASYELHIAGKQGLGLVPVRKDGTCRFAAIDLDDDNVSHQQLFNKIQQLKMPFNICRSKSGGAHFYLFMKEPGIKASRVIPVLRRWAGLLGFPTAEIFPKQSFINEQNLGNWINLPYYGGDATTRYCVKAEGALTLEQFLSSIEYWDGNDEVKAAPVLNVIQDVVPPPCLGRLMKEGLPEGTRNVGLLQFAIFFRKASPNGWEEQVRQLNREKIVPPLPDKEVNSIIRSADKKKYQYQCQQEPIHSRCDRDTCLTTPFGIGHHSWNEKGSLDEFTASHLRKILTDPPQYILEISGRDVMLSAEQFFNYNQLRDRVEETLDLVLPPIKEDRWSQTRKELHETQELIEAPDDASEKGAVTDHVMDFLAQFRRSTGGEDILKGMPVEKDSFICFKVSDLQNFLKLHRRVFISNHQLFQFLHWQGCIFKSVRINGKVVKVWMLPIENLNRQTEDFSPIKFNPVGDEL